MNIIYLLKFTRDDGNSFRFLTNEFFVNKDVAQAKAERLLSGCTNELARYEVHEIPLSWDEAKNDAENKSWADLTKEHMSILGQIVDNKTVVYDPQTQSDKTFVIKRKIY